VAINTPHHEGGRQESAAVHSLSPSTTRAPPFDRVPHQARVLSSIGTAGLHDELIRRRRGEDSCITIVHHRERCHNLERDFESLVPAREAPAARATRPLALQRALGGVWRLHSISEWWSGYVNSSPTYRRSTMEQSTPPNFYRSTPSPSSLQEEMRLS
jgi:hypothetical protein